MAFQIPDPSSLLSLSIFQTSLTKILMPISLLILTLWLSPLPQCQAENTPPVLNLKIALIKGTRLQVTEDTPIQSLLGLLEVEDLDKGPEGKVLCRSESNYVGLAEKGPNFYMVQLENHLDREISPLVDVVFLCTDNGAPPLSQKAVFSIEVIDVNDNKPRFTQEMYVFSMVENNDLDTFVGMVKAMDADMGENAEVSYFLEDENGKTPMNFKIDEKTGSIMCTASIDRESTPEIILYVYSEDHGIPPLHDEATIKIEIIDTNDNIPVIISKNFSIEEELNPMSFIGTIKAVDKDTGPNGEIVYSLIFGENGQPIPPFIVDSDGDIYAAVPLDRERRDEYTIQVSATDSGPQPLSTKANITIFVLDVNDNRPTILFPKDIDDFDDLGMAVNDSNSVIIDWYSPDKSKVVSKVYAVDEDIKENGRIFYSIESINSQPNNDDSLFDINKDTGQVFIRRFVKSSDDPVQVLSILVYDGGVPSLNVTVSLNVTLDVDFSALTSPPPTTSTQTGMSQKGPRDSASTVTFGFLSLLCSSFIFMIYFVI